jgi:hypothetical protein
MNDSSIGWARFGVWALAATIAVSAVALAADALVESDEERLTELAEAIAGGRGEQRVAAVLAWVDPERIAVTVRQGRKVEHFEADDDPSEAVREALALLASDALEVVQRTLDVRGDRATIALRIRADGELADLHIGLRRDGEAWRVSEVRRL